MVSCLDEIGARTGISSFYVAFVLAPLASNASEMIAAYNYALRKTSKTITVSLVQLFGAGCMNNTFSLGVFLLMVYTQGLAWIFGAETVVIVLIELVMLYFARKRVQTLFDACCIVSLYPVSLMLVAGLGAAGLSS